MRVAGRKTAGDEQIRPDAGVHGKVDTVEHLGLLPIVINEGHDVVGRDAKLRRDDVVEAADLIAAAVRQAGILRRGDAVLLEVARRDVQVVGGGEVPLGPPEIRQLGGDT